LLEEENTVLIHHLRADIKGNCIFISATATGCRLVVQTATNRRKQITPKHAPFPALTPSSRCLEFTTLSLPQRSITKSSQQQKFMQKVAVQVQFFNQSTLSVAGFALLASF
jgi:hypothetical protein